MALKYLVSNTTYDFGGPQYTNIGGSKRLNYIASGKTHQLGLATDKTCSQYSPLVMKVNGTNYYIGRSQSGSYITSDSILSTRISTRTSNGYSAQSYTYDGAKTYKCIKGRKQYQCVDHFGELQFEALPETSESHFTTGYEPDNSYVATAAITQFDKHYRYTGTATITLYTRCEFIGQQTLTATSNAYYTTIITNAVNTTVSTTKSASSSSHNFV